jgi:hypothetical protein
MTQREDPRAELEKLPLRKLQENAARLGIPRSGGMRKAELIDAILDRRSSSRAAAPAAPAKPVPKAPASKAPEASPAAARPAPAKPAPAPAPVPRGPGAPVFLVAIPIGPRRIFAAWEASEPALREARRGWAEAGVIVLRVFDRTLLEFDRRRSAASFDVAVHGARGDYYLNELHPNRSYQVELGLRASTGAYRALAAAPIAETPVASPPRRRDARHAPVHGSASARWPARAPAPAWPAPAGAARLGDAVVAADAATAIERPFDAAAATAAPSDAAGAAASPRAGWDAPEPLLVGAGVALAQDGNGNGNGAPPPGAEAAASARWGRDAESDPRALDPRRLAPPRRAADGGSEDAMPEEPRWSAEWALPPSSPSSLEHARAGVWPLPSSLELAPAPSGAGAAGGVSSLGLLPLVSAAPERQAPQEEIGRGVRLELHADLVVYGRTEPGTGVWIDHLKVPVREDGTFDARFALGHVKHLNREGRLLGDRPPTEGA